MHKYTLCTYRHIYGIGYRFIKPQGRSHWYPINEDLRDTPPQNAPFIFSDENFYMLDGKDIPLSVRLKLDTGGAQARLQQQLKESALRDLARDLKAGLDEEKLNEAIDFFRKHDDLFE